MCANPEDSTVLNFARDVQIGHLPAMVEVKAEWLTVWGMVTPSVAELEQSLYSTVPGA